MTSPTEPVSGVATAAKRKPHLVRAVDLLFERHGLPITIGWLIVLWVVIVIGIGTAPILMPDYPGIDLLARILRGACGVGLGLCGCLAATAAAYGLKVIIEAVMKLWRDTE